MWRESSKNWPSHCGRRGAGVAQQRRAQLGRALGPFARARSRGLLRRAIARCSTGCRLPALSATFGLHRPAQRIHEVDDLGRSALARRLDLLAGLLFLQQVLERFLVMVLEFLRLEMAGLGLDDVRGQLEHVLWDLLVRNVGKIVLLVAQFVGELQRDADQALAARFERKDVLA